MAVDLAVRGYMKIKQTTSKKLLFLSKRDYIFGLVKEDYLADHELKQHEKFFLTGIFESGKKEVTLSSLKNKFYLHLPTISDSIYRQLTREGCFSAHPQRIRRNYLTFGSILVIGGIILARLFARLDALIALPVAGAIIVGFSFIMPRLTIKGVNLLYQILGLKEFVKRAEKDRLERLSQEDPILFDRVLPYAMVMGDTFSSSPPRTSAAAGGSGFGGGFSGGGFGGGGGGTW